MSTLEELNPKSIDASVKRRKNKRNKGLLKETNNIGEEQEGDGKTILEEVNPKSSDGSVKRRKNKRNKGLLKETNKLGEEQEGDGKSILEEVNPNSSDGSGDIGINDKDNVLLKEADKVGDEEGNNIVSSPKDGKPELDDGKKSEVRKTKKKQRLLEETAKADQRGVCYLSRIPPHMDHVKLRQILSQYGEIHRIYLAPRDSVARVPRKQMNRKRDGGFQEQAFSEGWVEFTKKSVAKMVANNLNGEQIGGKKRSSFFYDLWNIKYLSKFKWDDLTEEIAYKSAIREQKLALEISAAKRERDFYLSKVEKSCALSAIDERLKKKQKVQQESRNDSEPAPVSQQVMKDIRQFSQKKPVADNAAQSKPRLSKDILAGVFGGSL